MSGQVQLAMIGLGTRGQQLLNLLKTIPEVTITALCDVNSQSLEKAKQILGTDNDAKEYKDYRCLISEGNFDGAIIATPILAHAQIAMNVMRAGKYAAIEAGGFNSVQQCWDLVHVATKHKTHCMLLENCCYGQKELLLLNMIQKGVFGDVVYCEGAYQHDLREILFEQYRNTGNSRILNYMHRNGDLYPTHALGPICKYLSVNKGNRLVSLTSSSTKAAGIKKWKETHRSEEDYFADCKFTQGDIVTTMIQCADGETILLTLDTTLPRPYSRDGLVQGTEGIWMENADHITPDGKPMQDIFGNKGVVHFDELSPRLDISNAPITETGLDARWENLENYEKEYEHPLWIEMMDSDTMSKFANDSCVSKGMDYLVLSAFIESIKTQTAPPIDTYDTATLAAITCLTEESIAKGSAPVIIPDFTNGAWIERKATGGKYTL